MRLGPIILVAAGFWAAAAFGSEAQTAKDRHEVRLLVAKYAQCVVHAHHAEAKTVLMTDSDNRDILRHHAQVIDSECMGQAGGSVEVRFPFDMYRYGLANALVRADFLKKGPESFADRLPLAQFPVKNQAEFDLALAEVKSTRGKKQLSDNYNKDRAIVAFSQYGECIARTDPLGTRLWILTEPDVPEELSRIKALMPAFQRCIQPGSTVKFHTEQLRGAVALSYYRLANATPQSELGAAH